MTPDDVVYVLQEQDMITIGAGASGRFRGSAMSKYKSRDAGAQAEAAPVRRGRGRPRSNTAGAAGANADDHEGQKIPEEYYIHCDTAYLNAHIKKYESKNYMTVKPECLRWTPFLVSRDPLPLALSSIQYPFIAATPPVPTSGQPASSALTNGHAAASMAEEAASSAAPAAEAPPVETPATVDAPATQEQTDRETDHQDASLILASLRDAGAAPTTANSTDAPMQL